MILNLFRTMEHLKNCVSIQKNYNFFIKYVLKFQQDFDTSGFFKTHQEIILILRLTNTSLFNFPQLKFHETFFFTIQLQSLIFLYPNFVNKFREIVFGSSIKQVGGTFIISAIFSVNSFAMNSPYFFPRACSTTVKAPIAK